MIQAIKEYFSQARRIRELEKECGEWRDKYYDQCYQTSRIANFKSDETDILKRDILLLTQSLQAKDFVIEKLESEVKHELL